MSFPCWCRGGAILLAAFSMACAPNPAPRAADELRAGVPAYTAPPPGHPFALVGQGMETDAVRAAVGKPTSQRRVPTAWAFMPFYFGSDVRRTEWKYVGQGRMLFATDGRTGELVVLRVEYDPREDGV
ncbi:MAG: hypothetical protein JRH01_16980 [Deltaproteobacteria bacterium]|nr:hypothetical protein [Deltaproteobacteria bacterium]MBW2396351.1 hypothetical protein [Deltaproteobacteria bacterium]